MTLESMWEKAYSLTEKERQLLDMQMIEQYRLALDDMNKELKKVHLKYLSGVKPEKYYAVMTKYNRLEALIQQTEIAYIEAAKRTGILEQEAAKLSISNTYYRQIYTVNWPIEGNNVFVVLPKSYIEASVYGTLDTWKALGARAKRRAFKQMGDVIDYIPKSGTLLSAILDKNKAADLQKLRQFLIQGMIQGKSYQKQVKGIREILNTSANNALRIARTEGHRNMMAGNYAMTQAARSQGVDVKRMIVSVLDDRTRSQSATVDARKENEDGYFSYPGGALVRVPGNSGNPAWDINDRESVIDIIEGVKPELRRARDPVTGETDIISYKSFDAWRKEKGLKKNKYGQIYT